MLFPFDESEIIQVLRSEPKLQNHPSGTEDELITKRHWGTYLASCLMIMRFLGQEWCNSHIMTLLPIDDCFQVNHNDNESHNLHCARVLEFADLLYNFQNVENFDDRIDAIKNDGRGVESGIAELRGGCLFRAVSMLFTFVKTQNRKTMDYDIEYVRSEGRVGICEVKCKIQSTELTKRAIYNSLDESRKQVPKNQGAVTLLVVPERWLADISASSPIIEAGVNEFYRRSRTSRISEVILFAKIFKSIKKGTKHFGAYRRFSNPYCADTSGIPPISSNPMAPMPNWKSIVDAVTTAYPKLGS